MKWPERPSGVRRGHCGAARRLGLTLIEMIIVMAIVVILSAIAVPAFVRAGAFNRDDLGDNARTVFSVLRAARVYAATFNTDTAVIYALLDSPDGRLEVTDRNDSSKARMQVVADGVAMARKMTDEEFADLELLRAQANLTLLATIDGERDRCYVMVNTEEGQMRQLSAKAAIWGAVDLAGPDADTRYTGLLESEQLLAKVNNKSKQGLMLVRLYRDVGETQVTVDVFNNVGQRTGSQQQTIRDFELIQPRATDYRLYGTVTPDGGGQKVADLDVYFPAHIFKPSGDMRTDSGTSTVRFYVLVGMAPTALTNDRFLDAQDTDYPPYLADPENPNGGPDTESPGYLDDPNIADVAVPAVRIELNQFTGRVRVMEQEYPLQ